jgi:hypothetical protein
LKQIRRHVTYANVMSSFAVFLILGGATAFAAVQKIGANEIKANSIKTGKIVKEAVTAGKIKKNAVTESRIADGAVTTNKLADNAVTTPKIANDAVINSKIANGAVTGGKIAAGTVTRANISGSNLIPRAYAFVNEGGTVEPGFTDGIPNPTQPAATEGIYCFDLSFSPVHAEVSSEGDSEPNDLTSVDIAGVNGDLDTCAAGNEVEVVVLDTETQALEDEDFFITLW